MHKPCRPATLVQYSGRLVTLDRRDVLAQWFDVSRFIWRLEGAAAARIIMLDYCRDDPF